MRVVVEKLLRLQTLLLDETPVSAARTQTAEDLSQGIPPPVRQHFDSLIRRGKKAIVAAVNGVCAGCHLGLSSGTLAGLRHTEDLGRCEHCGRYLHLLDAPPTPTANAVPFFMVPAVKAATGKRPRRKKVAA